MTRATLLAFAGLAALALAGCDGPSSILSKSEIGDCYQRTGTGSLGEAQFEKRPCPDDVALAEESAPVSVDDAAALAEDTEGQVTLSALSEGGSASAPTAATATTCVQVPVCAAPSGGARYVATSTVRPKVSAGKSATRRRATTTRRTTTTYSGGGGSQDYVGLGIDYARVGDEAYSQRQTDVRQTYSNTSADYSARTQSTYNEQSSASYSSSGSSGYAYAQTGQCCAANRGPAPHSTFDSQGFLTWAGKVQYQPGNRR
jgi:hypothetical protein